MNKLFYLFLLCFLFFQGFNHNINANEELDTFIEKLQSVDDRAYNAPQSVQKSIESLTAYLIEPLKTDYEKARVIYTWVANNISYDTRAFFSGHYPDGSAVATFRRRTSVCQGYAELYKKMANLAGLECDVVTGWAKGYGYSLGDEIKGKTNHAWNAVKISGRWALIDSTWGAGHINDRNQFEWGFNNFYFLPLSEELIFTHFPQDPKWQLLDKPYTKDEFRDLSQPSKDFFLYGLKFEDNNNRNAIIYSDGNAEVSLKSPQDLIFISNIKDKYGNKLSDNFTFVDKDDDRVTIKVVLPKKGTYFLNIYAKPRDKEGNYNQIITYKIISSGTSKNPYFPKTYSTYSENNIRLFTPLDGYLDSRHSQSFKVSVPGAEKVAVIMGDEWIYLDNKGDYFEKDVDLFTGLIKLSAQYPGENTFYTIAEYEGI